MNGIRQNWNDTRALQVIGAVAEELQSRVENISSNGSTTFINGNLLVSGEINSKSLITYPSTYTSKTESIEPIATISLTLNENGTTDTPTPISKPLSAGDGLFMIHLKLYTPTEISNSTSFIAKFSIGNSDSSPYVLTNGFVIVNNNTNPPSYYLQFDTSFVASSNDGDQIYIEILAGTPAVNFPNYTDNYNLVLRTNVSA